MFCNTLIPKNCDPSRIEEYKDRICSPAFREAAYILCEDENLLREEAGDEYDTIPELSAQFKINPLVIVILQRLQSEFFQDIDNIEDAEKALANQGVGVDQPVNGEIAGQLEALKVANEDALHDQGLAQVFHADEKLHDKYATQLKLLEEMGYPDVNQNLIVLEAKNGDVEAAIEFLVVE